tara:strand:- start:1934 stop:2134 length:201 start_codon:yes stop_codon:yes gene_type:complete
MNLTYSILSTILYGFVYYFLISPIGFIYRNLNPFEVKIKFLYEAKVNSYWIKKKPKPSLKQYKKQY